ncbi:MAG TPA: alcohol dehydrogenase catalytic domain-containing protein [Planctomycetes bacterium]|nr:alcohol dehydrogenase catalytic domain-containing protein [Planctomycetota bacterium]HIJ71000.1 alcohol dehydrogenase catalytic domain-containing protein [Planctomycetota bacterium]
MRAQVLTGIRQMELRDVAKPIIENDTDVLLKVECVGVCGSDVHYYETGRIGTDLVQFPWIVGHEFSATVVQTGNKTTRIKVGDEVVVDPAMSCGSCEQCRAGRENTCRNIRFLACPGQAQGCLCEYIVMPEDCCFPTAGRVTLEQGALCEPFSIGVYAVQCSQTGPGAKIAVLGSGPIGLSCFVALRAQSVKSIYMTDKVAQRVDIAKQAGAVWSGNPDEEDIVESIREQEPDGMDVVFECAGEQETLDEGIELLRPGGKLMVVGIPRFDRVSFIAEKMRRKEITIINVRRQNKCTQSAIDLIASGKADVDFMLTHRFEFENAQKAFDMVAAYCDGVVKALIKVGN